MEKSLRQCLTILGLSVLLVAIPVLGFGADLTIGNSITGSGNISLTGTITGSEIRSVNGSYYVSLVAPAGLSANKTWTLPSADGADGQVLKTNGSGTLSWADGGTGGSTQGIILNTGISVAAFGVDALVNNLAYFNTAVGDAALMSNVSGQGNTAIGQNALINNINGEENAAGGHASMLYNESGSYNTAFGTNSLYGNITGVSNNAFGDAALYNSTGDNNTAVGAAALGILTLGSQNTAIGNFADVQDEYTVHYGCSTPPCAISNATAIGYNAKVLRSNAVRIGNTAVQEIGGQVAWSNLSDIRGKKDIQDINFGLDFINSLRPVEYKLKDGNDRKDFGFIAQDIEALLGTEYNVLGIGGDANRSLSLRYTDFIAPMVKAMQEQQQIIEELRAELDDLKALILSMQK